MAVINYLLCFILPFLVGVKWYAYLNRIPLKNLNNYNPLFMLLPNLMTYAVTIYLFKNLDFNILTVKNAFILKYSVLNTVSTLIIVLMYSFLSKHIKINLRVEKHD